MAPSAGYWKAKAQAHRMAGAGAATLRPCFRRSASGGLIVRDVVEQGTNGLLFPVRSVAGLAETVRSFVALTPEQRGTMAAAARRTAEQRFGEEQVIAAYLAEVGHLLDGRSGRGVK